MKKFFAVVIFIALLCASVGAGYYWGNHSKLEKAENPNHSTSTEESDSNSTNTKEAENTPQKNYKDECVGKFSARHNEVEAYDKNGNLIFKVGGGHIYDEYFKFNEDGTYESYIYGENQKGTWDIEGTKLTYTQSGTSDKYELTYYPEEKKISLWDVNGPDGSISSEFFYYKDDTSKASSN